MSFKVIPEPVLEPVDPAAEIGGHRIETSPKSVDPSAQPVDPIGETVDPIGQGVTGGEQVREQPEENGCQ